MIVVCSLSDFNNVCDSIKPSHAISVIDPGFEPNTPSGVSNHLKLGFDDIINISDDGPLYRVPGKNSHIAQTLFSESNALSIVEFVNSWKQEKPIVIHCWCGISRSMATATYVLCKIDKTNITSQEFIDYMNQSGISQKVIQDSRQPPIHHQEPMSQPPAYQL